jgi:diaminopimelate epimerase
MRFTKMHGLGNDFVVVDGETGLDPKRIRSLCDRRFGVGADGVLRVGEQGGAVTMEYWNADGSPAEMCGNGLRCVARFAVDRRLVAESAFVVMTPAGPKRALVGDEMVAVDLSPISIGAGVTVQGVDLVTVDVGNPHAVALADPGAIELEVVGPRIEHDAAFPAGTNVEFYLPAGPDTVRMRVWERGVGETLACGSGMVAVAAVERRRTGADAIRVQVPGGEAEVRFDDGVWLVGPAITVFSGEID